MDQLNEAPSISTVMPAAPSPPTGPSPKCAPTCSSPCRRVIVVNAVVTIMIVASGLWAYDRYFAVQPPIAVDIKGYVAEQRQLYMDGRIDNKKLRENMDSLEAMIGTIPKHRPVVMADTVIKNVEILNP